MRCLTCLGHVFKIPREEDMHALYCVTYKCTGTQKDGVIDTSKKKPGWLLCSRKEPI